jgi:hypothetical protein
LLSSTMNWFSWFSMSFRIDFFIFISCLLYSYLWPAVCGLLSAVCPKTRSPGRASGSPLDTLDLVAGWAKPNHDGDGGSDGDSDGNSDRNGNGGNSLCTMLFDGSAPCNTDSLLPRVYRGEMIHVK